MKSLALLRGARLDDDREAAVEAFEEIRRGALRIERPGVIDAKPLRRVGNSGACRAATAQTFQSGGDATLNRVASAAWFSASSRKSSSPVANRHPAIEPVTRAGCRAASRPRRRGRHRPRNEAALDIAARCWRSDDRKPAPDPDALARPRLRAMARLTCAPPTISAPGTEADSWCNRPGKMSPSWFRLLLGQRPPRLRQPLVVRHLRAGLCLAAIARERSCSRQSPEPAMKRSSGPKLPTA